METSEYSRFPFKIFMVVDPNLKERHLKKMYRNLAFDIFAVMCGG